MPPVSGADQGPGLVSGYGGGRNAAKPTAVSAVAGCSDDSAFVYACGRTNTLYVFEVATGTVRARWPGGFRGVAWDGGRSVVPLLCPPGEDAAPPVHSETSLAAAAHRCSRGIPPQPPVSPAVVGVLPGAPGRGRVEPALRGAAWALGLEGTGLPAQHRRFLCGPPGHGRNASQRWSGHW